jgi:hypothetical protein
MLLKDDAVASLFAWFSYLCVSLLVQDVWDLAVTIGGAMAGYLRAGP